MLIFSYGSNMLLTRLQARIPSAGLVGVASLEKHKFIFNKRGNDGSAKANAFYTGKSTDRIWGVISDIDPVHKPVLDEIESLGSGYDEKKVLVKDQNKKDHQVTTYYAMNEWIDDWVKPFEWYRNFVLLGALENNLPAYYIEEIYSRTYNADPDTGRHKKNLRIMKNSEAYSYFSNRLL